MTTSRIHVGTPFRRIDLRSVSSSNLIVEYDLSCSKSDPKSSEVRRTKKQGSIRAPLTGSTLQFTGKAFEHTCAHERSIETPHCEPNTQGRTLVPKIESTTPTTVRVAALGASTVIGN
jgi:hypothetical protein